MNRGLSDESQPLTLKAAWVRTASLPPPRQKTIASLRVPAEEPGLSSGLVIAAAGCWLLTRRFVKASSAGAELGWHHPGLLLQDHPLSLQVSESIRISIARS
jgi:hypothetical protein